MTIENIFGGSSHDTDFGSNGRNIIRGNNGNATINGRNGNDLILAAKTMTSSPVLMGMIL